MKHDISGRGTFRCAKNGERPGRERGEKARTKCSEMGYLKTVHLRNNFLVPLRQTKRGVSHTLVSPSIANVDKTNNNPLKCFGRFVVYSTRETFLGRLCVQFLKDSRKKRAGSILDRVARHKSGVSSAMSWWGHSKRQPRFLGKSVFSPKMN